MNTEFYSAIHTEHEGVAAVYRNRSGITDTIARAACFQPDTIVTNSIQGCAVCRVYSCNDLLVRLESPDPLPRNRSATNTVDIYNTYSATEKLPAIHEKCFEQMQYTRADVRAVLTLTPYHKIFMYYSIENNHWIIFTNLLREDLFPIISAVIFNIRMQKEQVNNTPFTIPDGMSDADAASIVPLNQQVVIAYKAYVEFILQNAQSECVTNVIKDLYAILNTYREIMEAQKLVLLMETMQQHWDEAFEAAFRYNRRGESSTDIQCMITDRIDSLKQLQKRLFETQLYEAGLKTLAVDSKPKEFADYLKEYHMHKDLLWLITASNNTCETINYDSINRACFGIEEPLLFWNEDIAKDIIADPRTWLYVYFRDRNDTNKDFELALFKAIFIERRFTLHTVVSIVCTRHSGMLDTPVGQVPNTMLEKYIQNSVQAIKHPHIMQYNCWGDNAEQLNTAFKNCEYIAGFDQIVQVVQSINMADSSVMETLMTTLRNEQDKICLYDNANQVMITPRAAYNQTLIKEEQHND